MVAILVRVSCVIHCLALLLSLSLVVLLHAEPFVCLSFSSSLGSGKVIIQACLALLHGNFFGLCFKGGKEAHAGS